MRDSHREIYCEAREHAHVLSLEVKTGFHCFFLVHLILLFKKKKTHCYQGEGPVPIIQAKIAESKQDKRQTPYSYSTDHTATDPALPTWEGPTANLLMDHL